ncbi:MAG: alkaline phosphatase D family protein [Chloroflexi bacterium]|nr:alkaline phosphatase D family protein [Chloroflexota bacterium]
MSDDSPTERAFNYTALWSAIEKEAARGLIAYMSRREFMKSMGAGAALAALAPLSLTHARAAQAGSAAEVEAFPNGVASGDVTQTTAVLWARCTQTGVVTFTVSAAGEFAEPQQTALADVTDPLKPAKVEITGLTPGTPYTFFVTAPDGEATMNGAFRTAAPAGEQRGLRFGVSGDNRGELRPFVALRNVPERDLAFFVALGDTIYADYPSVDVTLEQCVTLEDYRRKHAEIYTPRHGHNVWRDIRQSVPILAQIDDHEVINDFAGGAAPETDPRFADDPAGRISESVLYVNGLQAFAEYHPIVDTVWEGTGEPRMDGKPKLYRYHTYGSDAAVFMIDARSFRDDSIDSLSTLSIFNTNAVREHRAQFWTEGRTMLGRPQVEQLKADLKRAQADGIVWKFVMLPEPAALAGWFGGNDRWEGYAPERNEVLRFIGDEGITNVVLVAADVHTTFINQLTTQDEADAPMEPSPVWEISTGSIAFYPPTGQALVDGAAQFNLIDSELLGRYRAGGLREKDAVLVELYDRFVADLQGLPHIGLGAAAAELVDGLPISGHSYGWTEFEIDAATSALTVTTYGIPSYSAETLRDDLDGVLARQPTVLSIVRALPA